MEREITLGSAKISVYVNRGGSISISDEDGYWVVFDECCAEKICRMIMETANEIRNRKDDA